MCGRFVALEDVYERGLTEFVKRVGYDTNQSAFISRSAR